MYYTLNREAVIFSDSDAQNGYRTIVYDQKEDRILEISPPLYHILKAMASLKKVSPGDLERLVATFASDTALTKKAIGDLVRRGIILKHGH